MDLLGITARRLLTALSRRTLPRVGSLPFLCFNSARSLAPAGSGIDEPLRVLAADVLGDELFVLSHELSHTQT